MSETEPMREHPSAAEQDASTASEQAGGGAATDEAALLWPEREVALTDGRVATVREMTWGQSMRLAHRWRPIADELFATVRGGVDDDADAVDPDAVMAIFEGHGEAVLELLAECTDLGAADIERLGTEDGQMLLVTWLGVHLPFFGRRLGLGRHMAAGIREGVGRARAAVGRSAPSSSSEH